jgi:HPt (histidine-containing phosphotransfer) domain-containing protein
MEPPIPPTAGVAELVEAMGYDNARTLVRTFLREFPNSLRELATADRKNGRRLAHRMKGESRMMGAATLSARMLELQERLTPEVGEGVNASDLAAVAAEFEEVALVLRQYTGD